MLRGRPLNSPNGGAFLRGGLAGSSIPPALCVLAVSAYLLAESKREGHVHVVRRTSVAVATSELAGVWSLELEWLMRGLVTTLRDS